MAEPRIPEESIFAQALEVPAAERSAFLDRACGRDARLRADVEALLLADDQTGDLLDLPDSQADTVDTPAPAEAPGTAIGPYKLLEQIGEGGFGVVYLAEQTRPVRRKVALKVLKPGMDTRQVVARFEAERQALALMDHANIACIHDGGTTAAGRPYFVMELVRGVPITDYCDHNHLDVRDRLGLFVSVCQAVQHAHQKGVIHRDLKPSNVMVTLHDRAPVPKVIDFGVAKALGQRLTDKTLFTGPAQMVGTPLYMSPEQAELSGLDIDTRSDVYSLGVLLYELLTGTTPFDIDRLRAAGYDELRRIIREEEPARPSSRVSTLDQAASTVTAAPRGDRRHLQRLLRGELDWVVMKCLEKDRSRRYETVDALAKDVERYLADEPVHACPPSTGYRVRKFVRRNRQTLLVASLLSLASLVAVGAVGWSVRDRDARAEEGARDRAAQQAEMDRERAVRQAEIARDRDGVLDQAAYHRDRGNWSEARASAQRANELLSPGGSPIQLERLVLISKDLDMVAKLEEIGVRGLLQLGDVSDVKSDQHADQAFDLAFRDYGIDVKAMQPSDAAERIRTSAIREPLLAALDDWAWENDRATHGLRMMMISQGPPRERTRWTPPARLATLASLADDDELRNRIRPPFSDLPINSRVRQERRRSAEELAARLEESSLRPPTAILLARVLTETGAKDKAVELLFRAQRRHPSDLRLNYELAWRLSPSAYAEQLGFLRAALALRPESPGLNTAVGRKLELMGEVDHAIAHYRIAIDLKPGSAIPHGMLGSALETKQAWTDAITAYTNAIAIDPYYCRRRGELFTRMGRWDLAAGDFRRFTEVTLRLSSELWCEFACVYLLADNLESYRTLCVRVLRTPDRVLPNPKSTQTPAENESSRKTYGRIAYLAARTWSIAPKQGIDPAEAVRVAERAVAAETNAWHLHTLGLAQYRAGEFDWALETIQKSMSTGPTWEGMACNHLALALIQHRLGRTDQARESLAKAVTRIEEVVSKLPKGMAHPLPGMADHDSLACYVLRREAEGLIRGEKK
ncbi:MAG TPA: protein kinase [Gemmataceae bacterium]|nr:protein kinase [Gemmataceae bacterium]